MNYQTQTITLGETDFTFERHHQAPDSLFLIRLHGDEVDAAAVGKWWVKAHGGTFIDVVNQTREVSFQYQCNTIRFDPNRVFSELGIIQTLAANQIAATPEIIAEVNRFSQFMIDKCEQQSVIIALHNNRDFNINFYLPGGECDGSAEAVHCEPNEGPHHLILTSERDDFQALKNKKVNCVLESKSVSDYPGAFSEYCINNKIRYFNIETYLGQPEKQKELLMHVADII